MRHEQYTDVSFGLRYKLTNLFDHQAKLRYTDCMLLSKNLNRISLVRLKYLIYDVIDGKMRTYTGVPFCDDFE
jgi:hypothetical protein